MAPRWKLELKNTAKANDAEPYTFEVYIDGELRHISGRYADGMVALEAGRKMLKTLLESEE